MRYELERQRSHALLKVSHQERQKKWFEAKGDQIR